MKTNNGSLFDINYLRVFLKVGLESFISLKAGGLLVFFSMVLLGSLGKNASIKPYDHPD